MPGSTRSYEMARRLVDKGHEVNMITSWRKDSNKNSWFETEEAGIKVHWLPVPYSNKMPYGERIKSFIKFAWKSSRLAMSIPCDLIFATSTPLTICLPGIIASWRKSIPMVFEVRDLWPDVPIAMEVVQSKALIKVAQILEKKAYNSSKRIVVLTPTMKDFLAGKGVPMKKIVVVPNGANLSEFSLPQVNNKSFTILYCGNLGPAHGVDYLCKLAKSIFNSGYDIHIKVAGGGKERENLENISSSDGTLGKTISFIGEINKCEVPSLYANSDASIMTICDCEILYRHSVQNKFFDSMMAGRPVFANYCGWASEIAENEDFGCIIPINDTDKAAKIMWDKLNSPNWIVEAAKKARNLAENKFCFDILAEELNKVLLEATEKD